MSSDKVKSQLWGQLSVTREAAKAPVINTKPRPNGLQSCHRQLVNRIKQGNFLNCVLFTGIHESDYPQVFLESSVVEDVISFMLKVLWFLILKFAVLLKPFLLSQRKVVLVLFQSYFLKLTTVFG